MGWIINKNINLNINPTNRWNKLFFDFDGLGSEVNIQKVFDKGFQDFFIRQQFFKTYLSRISRAFRAIQVKGLKAMEKIATVLAAQLGPNLEVLY